MTFSFPGYGDKIKRVVKFRHCFNTRFHAEYVIQHENKKNGAFNFLSTLMFIISIEI